MAELGNFVCPAFFPATTVPLTTDDQAYFYKHGLQVGINNIFNKVAMEKPEEPYKFIADEFSKLTSSRGAPAGITTPKKVADPKKLAEPKNETASAQKKASKPKKVSTSPEVVELGGPDEASKALTHEIREVKEKLKAEGLSCKQVNTHPDVTALVEKLCKLKEGGGSAPTAAPAKVVAAKPKAKATPADEGPKAKAAAKPENSTALAKPSKGGGVDVKKAEDTPKWYEQVIMKGELIDNYPVKGCFVVRPAAYGIWETISAYVDAEIKKLGVENCYFPMFIPKIYFEKEKDHLNDFAPELAWVSKFGDQDIEEPVAIRPTSETAMYASYSNWIQSHRDLPLKLNQWNTVVRWEVKQTTPFMRTREFLWQEGHTAHATKAEADAEVLLALEIYANVYENLLAIPVVRGTKTKAETFPGADYTTTVEALIPITGRSIQGATSHYLGQNFSKMFDISFQDPNDPTGQQRLFAHQNSWAITQRTIGVMVMVHGDDKGLVVPPMVAPFQVVIVPVGLTAKTPEEEKEKLSNAVKEYRSKLSDVGVHVKVDDRETYTSGNKFNFWEMKGVPIRIELGPKDLAKGEFVMAKRNTGEKVIGKQASLVDDVQTTLRAIQTEMYEKALKERNDRIASVDTWEEFSPNLNQGKLLLVPFCGEKECEEAIKDKSKEEAADVEVAGGLKMGAKSLCVPHEDKYNVRCPSKCIMPGCTSGVCVTRRTLFGRSY